jgi:hypothetical protein
VHAERAECGLLPLRSAAAQSHAKWAPGRGIAAAPGGNSLGRPHGHLAAVLEEAVARLLLVVFARAPALLPRAVRRLPNPVAVVAAPWARAEVEGSTIFVRGSSFFSFFFSSFFSSSSR